MKKFILVSAMVIFALALAGCKYSNNSASDNKVSGGPESQNAKSGENPKDYEIKEGDAVLFWGEGCPHCENIDKFLAENSGLAEKLNIKKIEVFEDLQGQKVFMEKVKECQLDQAGVPLFYANGQCIQGDAPVIEELKKSL